MTSEKSSIGLRRPSSRPVTRESDTAEPNPPRAPNFLLADRIAFVRRAAAELDVAGLRRRHARRGGSPACVRDAAERNGDAARRLVVRTKVRRALRVVAVVVGEVRFLRRDQIAKIRLHGG